MPRVKSFCRIPNCESPCVGHGLCRKHYKRWYRYQDPHITKRIYRNDNNECKIPGCNLKTLAKGLCTNHYALNRRSGQPHTVKQFIGHYTKDGYKYIYARKRHYEPEHRVLIEAKLGRKLTPEEHVHHIDGNITNNSIDNLTVFTRSQHASFHTKARGLRLTPKEDV